MKEKLESPAFAGQLFTRTGTEVNEVTNVDPPTEWKITLTNLKDVDEVLTVNLAEFKQLLPLVPKGKVKVQETPKVRKPRSDKGVPRGKPTLAEEDALKKSGLEAIEA